MKGSVKVYGRLLTYLKPYWKTLALAIAAAAGVSGLSALLAWMVKPALDDIFIAKKLDMLAILPLAVLVVSLLKGIFTYTQSVLMQYAGSRVIMDIRNALYAHIIYLPLRFFGDHSSAQLISRVTNDVGTMQMAIAGRSKDLLRESMTVVGLLFVVFYQKWDLAIISVLVLPLAVYPVVTFGRKLRKLSKKWQGKMANVTTVLSETFTGVRIVKAFGMEPIEVERFKKENGDYFDLTIKSVKTAEITSPMMEVIGGLGIAFVMWYGGSQVIKGTTTPGTFFSFLTALLMLYQPFKRLNKAYADIQQAVGSAERVFEIMDAELEHDDLGKPALQPLRESIEFRGVSFRYEEDRKMVLRGIDLRVPAGEIVALVGTSGGGKTSLVNLIPRFYDPAEGEILIDGINIRDVSLRSLRQQIGMVTQETILFNDTIRNNIAYGRPDATEEQIIAASTAAFAHDFIMEMPERYDTIVGEKGARLSGGQKQRLAIARAILKDSPILILDEATSALDTESEFMVQSALSNLMKDRTTFIIAHRLSTIKNAGMIAVISNGKIVEMGRHDELLEQGGVYRRLYQTQFRDAREGVATK